MGNSLIQGTWSRLKLGEVCTIQTGKYDANHAKVDGKYRFYTCAFEYSYCDTNRFKGESLILPGNGANVGEVFYYNGEFDAYQRTYVLNEIKTYPKYLYYHMLFQWKKRNQDKQYGSATNYIRMGNFTDYELPVPPVEVQQLIVSKVEELFSKLDKAIENLRLAHQQLKTYRQSILKWAFEGKLTNGSEDVPLTGIESLSIAAEEQGEYGGKLPKGWKRISLGDVIEKPKYGTSKKCSYESEGLGVLRIPNVVNGVVDASDLKFAEFNEDEIETYSLKDGDILIIRSNGSVDIVGKCALITKKEERFLYAGYLIRLRPLPELMLPKYLINILTSVELRTQIENKAKSTSGVNNINSEELCALKIVLPPLNDQIRIVEGIESRLSVADKMEESINQSLQQAEALRQSILKKAFEGKLI